MPDRTLLPPADALAASDETVEMICDAVEGVIANQASESGVTANAVAPAVHLFLASDALLAAARLKLRTRYDARRDGFAR